MRGALLTCVLTFCSFIFATGANGQTVIKIWPGMVPGETEPKHPAIRLDDAPGNIERYSHVTDPQIQVYRSKKSSGHDPAILICPGGGYSLLAMNLEGSEIAEWLSDMGFTAFVLQYRVPNKKSGALQDAQRAISVIRAQAQRFSIDPYKLGVMGFSAGGSLAARLSTASLRKYDVIDAFDSLSYKPDFALLIYSAYLDEGPDHTLSPDIVVNYDTPPMFVLQTYDDPSANSSLVMASALRSARIPVELHILTAKGKHGFGIRKGIPAAEICPGLAISWLQRSGFAPR